ncbi:hypothetical protein LXL04_026899 [Taraxacum kok-saghyz]
MLGPPQGKKAITTNYPKVVFNLKDKGRDDGNRTPKENVISITPNSPNKSTQNHLNLVLSSRGHARVGDVLEQGDRIHATIKVRPQRTPDFELRHKHLSSRTSKKEVVCRFRVTVTNGAKGRRNVDISIIVQISLDTIIYITQTPIEQKTHILSVSLVVIDYSVNCGFGYLMKGGPAEVPSNCTQKWWKVLWWPFGGQYLEVIFGDTSKQIKEAASKTACDMIVLTSAFITESSPSWSFPTMIPFLLYLVFPLDALYYRTESFETGETANETTGSGTFMEVMVYFTDPSVKVSPDAQSNPNTATI